jgi:hypothetical protein
MKPGYMYERFDVFGSNVKGKGETHPPTSYGVPSYHNSGDI